ncbi:cyclic pyranopterin monophosphate synthase MoaC [Maribellus comscasis]|uniref:Cyclic pyranopterin monophosphate synthase MoaC n=1 Tax=Maribellus comscasis TaxID=2681766 RepID=A0A6I6JWM5_9BACT|nr:cyclic pyranopterin monophosphate synthase MoaC [Maribellus comscasis]QGY44517.1 cyclic pyranopterin monophosphate synthase MoaC [Maribellus comscasis]
MNSLSHIDDKGKANMVDISQKPDQVRTASAEGFIKLQPETINLIQQNLIKKGDVVAIAEFAGIQAAKETSRLIPLCHNIVITKAEVKGTVLDDGIKMESRLKCIGKTGIEMEALTAVSVALLTIYDMCKAVDKTMEIVSVKLVSKEKSDV